MLNFNCCLNFLGKALTVLFFFMFFSFHVYAETYARAVGPEELQNMINSLTNDLQSYDPEKREAAVNELSRIEDSRAVDLLFQATKDENIGVKTAAARALAQRKDSRAIEPLIEIVNSYESTFFRGYALESLLEIEDPKINDALCTTTKDQDHDLRISAILGLAKRKDSRAIDPIVDLLNNDYKYKSFTVEKLTAIRTNAVYLLGEINDPRIIVILTNELEKNDDNWGYDYLDDRWEIKIAAVSSFNKRATVQEAAKTFLYLFDDTDVYRSKVLVTITINALSTIEAQNTGIIQKTLETILAKNSKTFEQIGATLKAANVFLGEIDPTRTQVESILKILNEVGINDRAKDIKESYKKEPSK